MMILFFLENFLQEYFETTQFACAKHHHKTSKQPSIYALEHAKKGHILSKTLNSGLVHKQR